jgi:hypothetical protein
MPKKGALLEYLDEVKERIEETLVLLEGPAPQKVVHLRC